MTVRVWVTLAVAGTLAACGKSATAGGAAPSLTVSVRDDAFSPKADSISVGDTVTFIWQGSQMHDLIFQDGIGNVSSPQSSGSSKRGFAAPGIYNYRCTLHSTDFTTGSMIGTIAVY